MAEEESIIQDESTTDCEFILGHGEQQETVRCHKLVLARASKVFRTLLYGPGSRDAVTFKDVEPHVFKTMRQLIYTPSKAAGLAVELMQSVFVMSQMFLVDPVEQLMLLHLYLATTTSNVCHVLEFAQAHNCLALASRCIKIIQVKTVQVLSSPGFLEISHDSLTTILQQCELNVPSEVPLIIATINWAWHRAPTLNLDQDNPADLISILGPAISHLRFFSLTKDQTDYLTIHQDDHISKLTLALLLSKLEIFKHSTSTIPRHAPEQNFNIFDFYIESDNFKNLDKKGYFQSVFPNNLHSTLKFQCDADVILTGVILPLGKASLYKFTCYKVTLFQGNSVVAHNEKTVIKEVTVFNFDMLVDQVKFKSPVWLRKSQEYRIYVELFGNKFARSRMDSVLMDNMYTCENHVATKRESEQGFILALSCLLVE